MSQWSLVFSSGIERSPGDVRYGSVSGDVWEVELEDGSAPVVRTGKGQEQHGGRVALMDVQRMARFEDRTMRRRTDATVQRRYWMACAIVKIGRYIAMTINPVMVPQLLIS